MDVILIAGLWLRSSVWDDVCVDLVRLGHRPLALRLPGVDDGRSGATLADQLDALLVAIDERDRPVVVGHSAASSLAWLAADRRPDAVRSAVLVGGFPSENGSAYAAFFPVVDGAMAFPGWGPFEGPDSADLDDETKGRLEAGMVAVPERVSKGVVMLHDDRRFDVPVVMVCPEYTPDQAKGWIEAGDLPELAQSTSVSFVDIDSGHWPMVSRPTELAAIIDAIARRS